MQLAVVAAPKASRHLAYLKEAGLIGARRVGKWMYYKLKGDEERVKKILAVAFHRWKTSLKSRMTQSD